MKKLPPLSSIEWSKRDKIPFGDAEYQCLVGYLPRDLELSPMVMSLGVDPGQNFGFAKFCGPRRIRVFWGSMPAERDKWMYGNQAYRLAKEFSLGRGFSAVVEGAIFKSEKAGGPVLFGEANLAYIREGFALGFYHGGLFTSLVPPASIRKVVFGDGKMRGKEVWPTLNANAADAVACALYAAGYKHRRKK